MALSTCRELRRFTHQNLGPNRIHVFFGTGRVLHPSSATSVPDPKTGSVVVHLGPKQEPAAMTVASTSGSSRKRMPCTHETPMLENNIALTSASSLNAKAKAIYKALCDSVCVMYVFVSPFGTPASHEPSRRAKSTHRSSRNDVLLPNINGAMPQTMIEWCQRPRGANSV